MVGDELVATVTGHALKHFEEHGGIIISASASATLLRAVRPDLKVVTIDACDDVAGTERVHVTMGASEASAAKLVGSPERVSKIVADIRARSEGRGRCLIVCPKVLEATVKGLSEGWADVEHYGAVSGLDGYKTHGVFATMGDPWVNMLEIQRQATHFGIDWETLWVDQVLGELEQAHGRARDPRRGSAGAAVHVHYGNVTPGRWRAADVEVEAWASVAQPKAETPDDVWLSLGYAEEDIWRRNDGADNKGISTLAVAATAATRKRPETSIQKAVPRPSFASSYQKGAERPTLRRGWVTVRFAILSYKRTLSLMESMTDSLRQSFLALRQSWLAPLHGRCGGIMEDIHTVPMPQYIRCPCYCNTYGAHAALLRVNLCEILDMPE